MMATGSRLGRKAWIDLLQYHASPTHRLMITRYKLTPKSSNRKTGPIATTMSDRGTCPDSCPFKNAGCYAEAFPLRLHWDRLTRGETGGDWLDLVHALARAKLPAGSLLRHNVAGDLPQDQQGRIVKDQAFILADIFRNAGVQAFTYTHHKQDGHNLPVVRALPAAGLFVNLSCDSEQQASQRHREGFAAVCVVPEDDSRKAWTDSHGVKFRVCPAQIADGVTCKTCKACAGSRDYVVAFRAHANRRRSVSDRLREAV